MGQIHIQIPGGGPGLSKFIHGCFGFLVGAVFGAVYVLAIDGPPKAQLIAVLVCAVLGAILGWLFDDGAQSDKANTCETITPTDRLGAEGMRYLYYPRWLVTLFTVSLGALAIGFLSALYIVLARFSTIALVGTYLIPVGLTTLYYLLGAAERRATE